MPRIHKTQYYKNFSMVYNQITKDPRISWQGRGIFMYLWSLPDNWQFHEKEIVLHSWGNGLRVLQKGVKELEHYKYLDIIRTHDKKGRIVRNKTLWNLCDKPANNFHRDIVNAKYGIYPLAWKHKITSLRGKPVKFLSDEQLDLTFKNVVEGKSLSDKQLHLTSQNVVEGKSPSHQRPHLNYGYASQANRDLSKPSLRRTSNYKGYIRTKDKYKQRTNKTNSLLASSACQNQNVQNSKSQSSADNSYHRTMNLNHSSNQSQSNYFSVNKQDKHTAIQDPLAGLTPSDLPLKKEPQNASEKKDGGSSFSGHVNPKNMAHYDDAHKLAVVLVHKAGGNPSYWCVRFNSLLDSTQPKDIHGAIDSAIRNATHIKNATSYICTVARRKARSRKQKAHKRYAFNKLFNMIYQTKPAQMHSNPAKVGAWLKDCLNNYKIPMKYYVSAVHSLDKSTSVTDVTAYLSVAMTSLQQKHVLKS